MSGRRSGSEVSRALLCKTGSLSQPAHRVWERPVPRHGEGSGSWPRPVEPQFGAQVVRTPLYELLCCKPGDEQGGGSTGPPTSAMKVCVGNQRPGPLLCPPSPRGVERGIWPWKRQEAPQASPKEVTAPALKDTGGMDTPPASGLSIELPSPKCTLSL